METICLQCGVKGFDNAFHYCAKCRSRSFAVHRYCLDVIPKTLEEYVRWICDDCVVPWQAGDRDLSNDMFKVSTGECVSEGGPQQTHDASTDSVKSVESPNTSFPTESREVIDKDAIVSTADQINRCPLISSQPSEKKNAGHANLLDDTSSKENLSRTQSSIMENDMVVVSAGAHVSEGGPQKSYDAPTDSVKCAESANILLPMESREVTNKDAIVASADEISSQPLEREAAAADKISSQPLEKENDVADEISFLALEKENTVADKISSGFVLEKENADDGKISSELLENENVAADKIYSELLEKENTTADKISSQPLEKEDVAADKISSKPLEKENTAANKISSQPLKKENASADKISFHPLMKEKTSAYRIFSQLLEKENAVADKISSHPLEKENAEDKPKRHANLSNGVSSKRNMNNRMQQHTPCRSDAKPGVSDHPVVSCNGSLIKSSKKRKKCPNKNWSSKKRRRDPKNMSERPVVKSSEVNSEARRHGTRSQLMAETPTASCNESLNGNPKKRTKSPNKNWSSRKRIRNPKNTSERPVVKSSEVYLEARRYGTDSQLRAENPTTPCNGSLNKNSKKRKNNSSGWGENPKNRRSGMHGTRFHELPYENKGSCLENQRSDMTVKGKETRPRNNHFKNRESHVREKERSYAPQTNNSWNHIQGDSNASSMFDFQRCPEQLPIVEPIWRGSFNTWSKKHFVLDGLMAHLSNQACQKVFEQACQLQTGLQLEMLPKSYIWPKSFQISKPTAENIALYFFPSEISERSFDHMVDDMLGEDLAMRVCMQAAELLIFPSTDLPMKYWRFQGKHYLWGVFRGKQVAPSHSHSVVADSVTLLANYGNGVTVLGATTNPWRSPCSPLSTRCGSGTN